MITLEHERLRVVIANKGGELQSIFGKQTGTEYLWQGGAAYWSGRAPNLFPFVGRLFEKRYTVDGRSYPMGIHGFAAQTELETEEAGPASCVLLLRDSDATRAVYPYRFEYRVRYTLDGSVLRTGYEVTNLSPGLMYFCLGGHPGFNVPLEKGLSFDDYQLAFSEPSEPRLIGFSEGGLTDGSRPPFPLLNGTVLPLRQALFDGDSDSVFLADAPRGVTLASPKGSRGLRVTWPDMRYIGFWHTPRLNAPYLCIEPWSALPGREGVVEELSSMPERTVLAPGETSVHTWAVEVW